MVSLHAKGEQERRHAQAVQPAQAGYHTWKEKASGHCHLTIIP
jgi:hypothetical protein